MAILLLVKAAADAAMVKETKIASEAETEAIVAVAVVAEMMAAMVIAHVVG